MAFDLYQHVTDQIIASIEAGTPAWRKPWTGEKGGAAFPRRANGEPYRGINVLMLWLTAHEKGYGAAHYRIDPERNLHRYYHLRVERTLFGSWALIREWGRIGARSGQVLEQWFDTVEAADHALRDLETRKRRRGYLS